MVLRAASLVLAFALPLARCDAPRDPTTAQTRAPTIYGTDDRIDVYAETNATLQTRALQSAVVLTTPDLLDTTSSPPNVIVSASPNLQSAEGLCSSERFLSDPTIGFCSGTLVDDDLVLTAGHCITNATDCANTRFVFNYARASATTLDTITTDDVYSCASIVVRQESTTRTSYIDYAIVRLDRAATPQHMPAPVYLGHGPMTNGESVTCIGFPSGIPCKIDSGGTVRDARASSGDYFLATTDTFGGNSGSGIYDTATATVHGLLLQGDQDYVPSGSCNVAYRCSPTGCSGETIGYVSHALDAFCAVASSTRLCCGNGTCDPSESSATCPVDCGGASDGGVPIVDAGTPDTGITVVDAGTPDTGITVADAGTPDTGTTTITDAGQGADGAREAGSIAHDASGDGGTTQMAAGCGCRVPTSPRRGALPSGISVVGLSVALARRRRSTRG